MSYFDVNNCEQHAYFRVPKILIRDDRYKELSNDAKLLYGMMLDRMELSIKNGWFDKESKVYIIYTHAQVMEDMNCASQKATKLLKELDDINLIDRQRGSRGGADIIYVLNFIKETVVNNASNDNEEPAINSVVNIKDKTFENQNSSLLKIKTKAFENHRHSNTDYNNTDLSNTNIKNTNISTANKKFTETDKELAIYICGKIKERAPYKKVNIDKAAKDVRDMRVLDKIPLEEIRKVFDWTNGHVFWKTVIFCTKTFRAKFGDLHSKHKSDAKPAKKDYTDVNRYIADAEE